MLDKVQELAAADEVLTDLARSIGHLDLPDLEHREKHSIGLRFCLPTPAKRREIVQASTMRTSRTTEVDVFTLDSGEITGRQTPAGACRIVSSSRWNSCSAIAPAIAHDREDTHPVLGGQVSLDPQARTHSSGFGLFLTSGASASGQFSLGDVPHNQILTH